MANWLKPRNKKWESAALNNATFNDYVQRLTAIAVSMYEWKGLPPTVDERFLEYTLFMNGVAVFFLDDSVNEFLATETMYGGNFDVYRIPNDRRAYAVNGYNRQLDASNSVLIFDNYIRMPAYTTIELFARRLTELERTIDVNVKAQKTPVIIKATQKQRLTMKNLFMQYDGNEPFIFADDSMDMGALQAINTQSPYVSDRLQTLKVQIWQEALNYLGVETMNVNRRERTNQEETTHDLGYVEAQRYVKLNARRQAAALINTMFGLDISVDFRGRYTSIDTEDTDMSLEVTPSV